MQQHHIGPVQLCKRNDTNVKWLGLSILSLSVSLCLSFSLQVCQHRPGAPDRRLQERPPAELWAGQKVCKPGEAMLPHTRQLCLPKKNLKIMYQQE